MIFVRYAQNAPDLIHELKVKVQCNDDEDWLSATSNSSGDIELVNISIPAANDSLEAQFGDSMVLFHELIRTMPGMPFN